MDKVKVSAFRWVPPFARGLVRDLRVRWAREEAGLPYLLMTTVLRILRTTDRVAAHPPPDAYRLRCEARPAFGKALADQMAVYAAHAPPARATP